VMSRLGLGYEQFAAVNPDVVMLSISGFGQQGVWSQRAAFAPIIHAESGLMGRQSRFDGTAPSDPMLSIADTNASLHGLVALLAALHLRDREGVGQHIDIAMLNTMTVTDDYAHNVLDPEGEIIRLGGHTWPTSYGNILVSGNERAIWYQLSTASLVDDGLGPEASLEAKIEARHQALSTYFVGFGTRDELVSSLDSANVAWADVREPEEVFFTEAAEERALSVEIDDRAGSSRRVVQSPYHFSNARSAVRGTAPHRGEHNVSVLADWLGSTEDEVSTLLADGVLLTEELSP